MKVAAGLMLAMVTSFTNASSLSEVFTNNERIMIDASPDLPEFGRTPNIIIQKSGDSSALLSLGNGYDLKENTLASLAVSDSEVSILTNDPGTYSISYFYFYGDEDLARWGDEVVAFLEEAYSVAQTDNPAIMEIYSGTESITLSELSVVEGEFQVNVVERRFETLLIPQTMIDNVPGNWNISTENTIYSSVSYLARLVSADVSLLADVEEFTSGQWALPFVTDYESINYASGPNIVADLTGNISSGLGMTVANQIEFAASEVDEKIVLSTDEYRHEYLPYGRDGKEWEVLVNVYDGNELRYSFAGVMIKKDDSTENFTKHLTTQFPFIQNGFLNGRAAEDDALLDCIGVFGYVFNNDNSLDRGLTCRSYSPYIYTGTRDWEWHVDSSDTVTLQLTNTSGYYKSRVRYWYPIATDSTGLTRVLEHSYASIDNDGDGFADTEGNFIKSRINSIGVLDLSRYEDEYTSAGFQGDHDGDGINDSQDEDDDNDGMPDLFENSFSLNHLEASDASDDIDGDGLTNYEEYLLGTDPSSLDSDSDGASDGDDPYPLDANISASNQILDAKNLSDIDGDGINDWFVAHQGIGELIVKVYSGADGTQISNLVWTQSFTNISFEIIDDTNGNGAQEIAVFGYIEETNGLPKSRLFALDGLTGDRTIVHTWPANWSAPSFLLVDDVSGDGIRDIAVQGIFKEDNRPQLFVKDSITGDKLVVHSYPSIQSDTVYFQHSDFTGDNFGDIGLYGRLKSNNKVQIKLSDGVDGEKYTSYTFPDNWSNTSWHRLSDMNNDGSDDWGLFGTRRDDGRSQVFTKSGKDKAGTLGIYSWPETSNSSFHIVDDMNNDSVNELAVAGYRSDIDKYQMVIKDGKDNNITLSSIGWPDNWTNETVEYLGDLNGDNVAEVAIFGQREVNNRWQLNIKSLDGSSYDQFELGAEWDEKPDYIVINSAVGMSVFVYGMSGGTSVSKMF